MHASPWDRGGLTKLQGHEGPLACLIWQLWPINLITQILKAFSLQEAPLKLSATFGGANIGSNWDGASLRGTKNLKNSSFVGQFLAAKCYKILEYVPYASLVRVEGKHRSQANCDKYSGLFLITWKL